MSTMKHDNQPAYVFIRLIAGTSCGTRARGETLSGDDLSMSSARLLCGHGKDPSVNAVCFSVSCPGIIPLS